MKLLADAHISRAMLNYLLGLGHDILYVAVISPRMSDSNILKLAAAEGRIVITADKDFGELCFLRLIPCTGVILLRLIAPTETARLEIFKQLWPVIEKNVDGHFIVVTDTSIRRSLLPTIEEQQ
jgi:predicted nuclease of predicted toxin-antitoxin system